MILLWRFSNRRLAVFLLAIWLVCQNLGACSCLNEEGMALLKFKRRVESDPFGALSDWKDDVEVVDPCSWVGVECSDGNVVVLDLKDLGLRGTLSPDLESLIHVRIINLRNNSFYGLIPEEIAKLKDLEVLDLGYNKFNGPLPADLVHNRSLMILLLDNNNCLGCMSPEIYKLETLSDVQLDKDESVNNVERSIYDRKSISWNSAQTQVGARRRPLQAVPADPSNQWVLFPIPEIPEPFRRPTPSPPPSSLSKSPASSPAPTPAASVSPSPSPSPSFSVFPPPMSPTKGPPTPSKKSSSRRIHTIIFSVAIAGSAFLIILGIFVFLFQTNKVTSVRPWATGLSGQLQKAFVTGVPKLRRSEIESACEDFSNVISSSLTGSIYKGTLSSGVEIAVVSLHVASSKDWPRNTEAQFRKKIETLSKVNHKNFVNLLGYCEEEQPFTRMLVFEYAPNGTLFEHLHIKEAEHLDWGMRTRIIMGTAYCLEHMHQLRPAMAHNNLHSSAVYLTEDYAAKISDFGLSTGLATTERESSLECNVYSFGVLAFEAITGRMPYTVDNDSLEDWASDYLRGDQPLRQMVDPTLTYFNPEQLEAISELIRACVHTDPCQRPQMREVTSRLRDITGIGPDGAIPKLSPLWWAELEILSTEAS